MSRIFRKSATLLILLTISAVLMGGCGEQEIKQSAEDESVSGVGQDGGQTQQEDLASVHTASSVFDPREVKVGDQVAGLNIESIELLPVSALNEGLYVDGARIAFSGGKKVAGNFVYYSPEHPTLGGQIVLYPSDNHELPVMRISDDASRVRPMGIVLKGEAANRLDDFGEPGTTGDAIVHLEAYTIQFSQTDLYDMAIVSEVLHLHHDKNKVEDGGEEVTDSMTYPVFSETAHEQWRDYVRTSLADVLQDIADLYPNDPVVGLPIAAADLNGDGSEDFLVALQHPHFGYAGNSVVHVYHHVGEGSYTAYPLSSANLWTDEDGEQTDIAISANKDREWGKIIVNNVTWVFSGDKYEIEYE